MDSLTWEDSSESVVYDPFKSVFRMYFRFKYDEKEQLDEIREVFSPITELHRKDQPENEIAFVTAFDSASEFASKINVMNTHGVKLLGGIRLL